jgi:hypothetical protein
MEGLRFWQRRVGVDKVNKLLLENSAKSRHAQHEMTIELNQNEMKSFYERTALPNEA